MILKLRDIALNDDCDDDREPSIRQTPIELRIIRLNISQNWGDILRAVLGQDTFLN